MQNELPKQRVQDLTRQEVKEEKGKKRSKKSRKRIEGQRNRTALTWQRESSRREKCHETAL